MGDGTTRREVRLFGGLRPIGDTIVVEIPETADAESIKAALAVAIEAHPEGTGLGGLALVSALADDYEVLEDHAVPDRNAVLALLPPVSGG